MTKATREHKEAFIRSFGSRGPADAVAVLFNRYGLAILTDDLLDEAVRDFVAQARFAYRIRRRNRALKVQPPDCEVLYHIGRPE